MARRAVAKEGKAPIIEKLRSAIRDGTHIVPARELAVEFVRAYYAKSTGSVVVRRPLSSSPVGQLIDLSPTAETEA